LTDYLIIVGKRAADKSSGDGKINPRRYPDLMAAPIWASGIARNHFDGFSAFLGDCFRGSMADGRARKMWEARVTNGFLPGRS
jgi:hypothetical protein